MIYALIYFVGMFFPGLPMARYSYREGSEGFDAGSHTMVNMIFWPAAIFWHALRPVCVWFGDLLVSVTKGEG